jgi:hypothetical protein
MQSLLSRFRLKRGAALPLFLLMPLFDGAWMLRAQPTSGPLPACRCDDIPRLKDRLQKLMGIQKLIARKLQSVGQDAPATQADWDSLQTQINNYLRALQMQNLTEFPDTSLFPIQDPNCAFSGAPAESCREQEYSVHEQGHSASCRAGKWSWHSPWLAAAMLQEESAALGAEIAALKDAIDGMPCAPCPRFIVTVQVITNTAFSGNGLNERSSRSLNNGQGIQVPLTMQANGIFSGVGTGVDAGSARGSIRGESISGQFGHFQSVYATGTIQPGGCDSPPCPGDMMHLTLTGGSSQQITEMQARGVVNRDLNQTTPTGAATLSFDLPAYIGSSAQRTLLANGIVNSVMHVTLGQLGTGATALPAGSSLLYSMEQCGGANQVASNNPPPNIPPSGGGGGPGGGSGSGSGGSSGGGTGTPSGSNHIPLVVNESITLADQFSSPVAVNISENLGLTDAVEVDFPVSLKIDENIKVSDTIPGELTLNISEKIHIGDGIQSSLGIPLIVSETISVVDEVPAEVVLNIAEKIKISDAVATQP